MSAFRPSDPLPGTAKISAGAVTLGDFAPQLRDMLADEDWRPACHNYDQLKALADTLATDPEAAHQPPPETLTLLVASYADFCRFRRGLAAALNIPDDEQLHVSPDEWLQHRLRHYGQEEENQASFADYRLHRERFRVT